MLSIDTILGEIQKYTSPTIITHLEETDFSEKLLKNTLDRAGFDSNLSIENFKKKLKASLLEGQ